MDRKNGPIYGKYHSEETKLRISNTKKGMPSGMKGKHLSEETKRKLSGVNSCHYGKHGKQGAESCHWKGGLTSLGGEIRNSFKYRQWRFDVFTRDNFICQHCGERGGNLNVHHIKSFSSIIQFYDISTLGDALNCSELWNIDNGITYCKDYHKHLPRKIKNQIKIKK
jgi:hypothetical protein